MIDNHQVVISKNLITFVGTTTTLRGGYLIHAVVISKNLITFVGTTTTTFRFFAYFCEL